MVDTEFKGDIHQIAEVMKFMGYDYTTYYDSKVLFIKELQQSCYYNLDTI